MEFAIALVTTTFKIAYSNGEQMCKVVFNLADNYIYNIPMHLNDYDYAHCT